MRVEMVMGVCAARGGLESQGPAEFNKSLWFGPSAVGWQWDNPFSLGFPVVERTWTAPGS